MTVDADRPGPALAHAHPKAVSEQVALATSIVDTLHAADALTMVIEVRAGRTREVSGRTLAQRIIRTADALARTGAPARCVIALQLGNHIEMIEHLVAAWLAGFTPLPLSRRYDLDDSSHPLFDRAGGQILRVRIGGTKPQLDFVGPGRGPQPQGGYLLTTGGTSGHFKLCAIPELFLQRSLRGMQRILEAAKWRPGMRQLVAGPLRHATALRVTLCGLLNRNPVVILGEFSSAAYLACVARFQVQWSNLTPAQMIEIALAPDFGSRALASIESVLHGSARCPRRVRRAWIAALGADNLHELYAATELTGAAMISGSEWLSRPTSVGRGFRTEFEVRTLRGDRAPPGELGTLYMRSKLSRDLGPWLAATAADVGDDGFCCLGDLGWIDEAGYVTLCGRREPHAVAPDLVRYQGLVEDALMDVDGVQDAAVLVDRRGEEDAYCAFFVCTEGADDPSRIAASILDALGRSFPVALLPRRLMRIAAMPRNAAGKLPASRLISAHVLQAWTSSDGALRNAPLPPAPQGDDRYPRVPRPAR